jgi:hypothetical protein
VVLLGQNEAMTHCAYVMEEERIVTEDLVSELLCDLK